MSIAIFVRVRTARWGCAAQGRGITVGHAVMEFGLFAVMNGFNHFGADERTAGDDAINRDRFAEVGCAEGAGVDVVVAERALEADVEDSVFVDVGVLMCSEGHGGFLERAIEGREEVCWFVQDTANIRHGLIGG